MSSSSSSSTRIVRLILVAAAFVAVIVSMVLVGLNLTHQVDKPISYWQVDAQTLDVIVVDLPGINCAIGAVQEAADRVTVSGQCAEPVLSMGSPAMAVFNHFTVRLQGPLGDRQVVDSLGQPATRCPNPQCI